MIADLEKSKLEDAALAGAYDSAINALGLARARADQAYNDAFAQFNVMENLRGTLRDALQQAQDRIQEAAEFIAYDGQSISDSPLQLLRQARTTMPSVRDGADADTTKGNIASAGRARDLASQTYSDSQGEYESYQAEQQRRASEANIDAGANIALGVLGALLSSGGRSGGYSSGGSSGGSRGGGSWGGGSGGGFESGGW